MKKFYTEVLIPRVKNWGSENRWEKLGPQDVKNTPRSPGKDRCVIEANMNLGASSILERGRKRAFESGNVNSSADRLRRLSTTLGRQ
jgi:hypothetical protein